MHNLHLLGALVTPRVVSACFSTIWNRWTTMRRFQKRASESNHCKLGCGGEAEDSIEHYARCGCVRQCGTRILRMPSDGICVHTFLLCDPRIQTREQLILCALLIYASYRAFNHYKHTTAPTAAEVHDAMSQWCKEGVRGHRLSTNTLEQVWQRSPPSTPLPPMPANVCLTDARIHPHKKRKTKHH